MEQPFVEEDELACLQCYRDGLADIEVLRVGPFAEAVMLQGGDVGDELPVRTRDEMDGTVLEVHIVDGEPGGTDKSRFDWPVVSILMPWDLVAAYFLFRTLDKRPDAPEEEVAAEDALDRVQQGWTLQ